MSGEKTEKATPKRKQDERKKGNVFLSRDAVTAVSLLVMFYVLKMVAPFIVEQAQGCIQHFFSIAETQSAVDAHDLARFFISAAIFFCLAAMPLLLTSGLVAIFVTMLQTKMLFSTKAFSFKMSKLNPISGLKKMFSLNGVVELLKSILKIIILGYIIYSVFQETLPTTPLMMDMQAIQSMVFVGDVIMRIALKVGIAFIALSAGDFFYQWWQYEKNLRMSKQEIKDEYKQSEGDPQVKGHIRSLQQQMARRRMMQSVPEADVVVRNPTHYAVALKYDRAQHRAPVVVAKGADHLALRIIQIAEAAGVAVTEDKPLARALYETVEVDSEIPEQFYQPIAKVLAFVYSLKNKERK